MNTKLVKDIRDFLGNPTHCEEGDHAATLLQRVLKSEGIPLVATEDVTAESLVKVNEWSSAGSHILTYDFRAWFPEEVFYDNHDVVRFLKRARTLDTNTLLSINFDAEACQLYAYGPRASLVAAAQAIIDYRRSL